MDVLLGNLPTIFALIITGISAGLLTGLLGVGGALLLFRYYIFCFKVLVFQRKAPC
jgi:uncharacterized membrane protein YfcA